MKCTVCNKSLSNINSDYYCSLKCAMVDIDRMAEVLKKQWQAPTRRPIDSKLTNKFW